MRLHLFSWITLLCLTTCTSRSEVTEERYPAANILEELHAHFVPDRRVNRLDVELVTKGNATLVLRGETTLPSAKDSLLQRLNAADYTIIDSITLLPAADLGEQYWGLIRVSVANLRSAPGHSQELATQLLLGTPVRMLKQQAEWYQVQTPYGYIAWLNKGEFVRMNEESLALWRQSDRVVYAPTYGKSYTTASTLSAPVGDLVMGDVLLRQEQQANMTKVAYPDGRIAYVLNSELIDWSAWTTRATKELAKQIVAQAEDLLGIPYLWGGTSIKGMDCSGFTKTLYWQQGLIIPRDASQQVHAGTAVGYEEDLTGLLSGDFLFFGRYREDGTPKVTHVGVYMGDGYFIHSGADNGQTRIQSLLPAHPEYAAHRRESLLAARRLSVGSVGVQKLSEHPWY